MIDCSIIIMVRGAESRAEKPELAKRSSLGQMCSRAACPPGYIFVTLPLGVDRGIKLERAWWGDFGVMVARVD